MRARTLDDIEDVRRTVTKVRRLSDRLIGVGPFGIGIDGLSGFIPGLGLAYSLGAGAILMNQAVKARAHPTILAKMAAMLLADSAIDVLPLPVLPGLADVLFTGHRWAAEALLKHLDETHYYPGDRAAAAADPRFQAFVKGRPGRVVHLGED